MYEETRWKLIFLLKVIIKIFLIFLVFKNIFSVFSVIGLNFDYVYLNIVGHSVYGAFNVGLFWVKTIQVKNAASIRSASFLVLLRAGKVWL